MIDLNEIHAEIDKLENSEHTTYSICEKLAILYIVRDHYKKTPTSVTPTARSNAMPGMTTP